jgi:hypothetical protein
MLIRMHCVDSRRDLGALHDYYPPTVDLDGAEPAAYRAPRDETAAGLPQQAGPAFVAIR